MDKMILISAVAVIVAMIAALTDIRERRIPNKLTYPAAMLGLLLQATFFGWKGLLSALLGAGVLGGIFLLFYIIHAMGAGDLKLGTALGCIAGLSASANLLFAISVAGGVLAIIHIVRTRTVVKTLRNTLEVLSFHAQQGLQTHPTLNLDNPKSVRMPYGLAFAAGTIVWSISLSWR
jgi:prepilin peptidase CpaA